VMGYFDKNNQFSMNVMKSICGDLKKMITWWIYPKQSKKD
jgi:hypothetical protein